MLPEIHQLAGKKVFSVTGNVIDGKGQYEPLKIIFEGGGCLVVDEGTFDHPDEPQCHLIGQHLCSIVKRIHLFM